MKNRLLRYEDFRINESVSLLLEANIAFSEEFENLLDKMDTVVADKLLNMIGKDIDVNTNYIDVDIEKDGFVKFVADDKAEKLPFVVQAFPTYYLQLSKDFGLKDVDQNSVLMQGMKVSLVKRYTKSEFLTECKKAHGEEKMDAWTELADSFYGAGSAVCVVTFEIHGMSKEVLCHSDSIKRDISDIKPGSLKIGKLATALFTKAGVEFKPTEIEDFVNRYKSVVKQMRDKFDSFKIVKGEEIRKNYLHENYLNMNGSLGNSCMRYDKCQSFLDIYVENEDKVSLVVLMNDKVKVKKKVSDGAGGLVEIEEEMENKVTGRAILWTDKNDRKVMDRIYTNNSADEQLFKDFAKANNFWYKKDQNMYEDTPFIGPNREEERYITVYLKSKDYEYYPYMDSLKFYNPGTGKITNSDDSYEYELTDTDGGNGRCDECGGGGRVECGTCDGDGEVECGECGGNGENECGECDGNGNVDCTVCEGDGKEECDYCSGKGESDCSSCDGEGIHDDEECSECGGSGKASCEHCEGVGSRECNQCDGEGTKECRECGGDGSIECSNCAGNRNVECYNCEGEGRVDCYNCG